MCPHIFTSLILLCPASFTRDLWQFQTTLESIWKLLRALVAASLAERMDILTRVALILQYAHLNDVYKVVSKIFKTGAANHTGVVVAQSTGRW